MAKVTITVESEMDDDGVNDFFKQLANIDNKAPPEPKAVPKSIDLFLPSANAIDSKSSRPHTITGITRKGSNDVITFQEYPGSWTVNCRSDGRPDRVMADRIRDFLSDEIYPVKVYIDMERPNNKDKFERGAWTWTRMSK